MQFASRTCLNRLKKKQHQMTASASRFLYVPLPRFGLFSVAAGRAKCGLSDEKCGLLPRMWTIVYFMVKNVDWSKLDPFRLHALRAEKMTALSCFGWGQWGH
jgi:hypothetical protein